MRIPPYDYFPKDRLDAVTIAVVFATACILSYGIGDFIESVAPLSWMRTSLF